MSTGRHRLSHVRGMDVRDVRLRLRRFASRGDESGAVNAAVLLPLAKRALHIASHTRQRYIDAAVGVGAGFNTLAQTVDLDCFHVSAMMVDAALDAEGLAVDGEGLAVGVRTGDFRRV